LEEKMEVKFYNIGEVEDRELKFAVICANYLGQWIFVRHKERKTWEIPGGHRELNEDINDTAARELYEETGTKLANISPLCDYRVKNDDRVSFGRLFYAEIEALDELPNLEIGEIIFATELPKNLTYPEIQPHLHRETLRLRKLL